MDGCPVCAQGYGWQASGQATVRSESGPYRRYRALPYLPAASKRLISASSWVSGVVLGR
jgi:hypothetical protein